MNGQRVVGEVRQALEAVATQERATKEKQYLKSELEHLGVTMPALRKVAKATLKAQGDIGHAGVWALVDALWSHPVHELRAVAVEVLCAKPNALHPADLPRLQQLIIESKTWALVDPLAIAVVGDLVARHDACRDVMDDWSVHADFWVRRSAMLSLLRPLRRGEGDFERFARYADAMLEEKEFFIRKAIGWVLREASKKTPDRVHDWIEPRIARASGVTMREAVKYLPDGEALMQRYKNRKT